MPRAQKRRERLRVTHQVTGPLTAVAVALVADMEAVHAEVLHPASLTIMLV